MKITQSISYLLLGAFILAPLSVFAEETVVAADGSVTVSQTTTAEAPVPTLYRESPTKQQLLRESPTKGTPPNSVMTRGAGKVATGTRMLASSTRPLPVLLEKRIEKREEQTAQRKADCISPSGAVSSTTDCIETRTERREEIRDRVAERKGEVLRALANLLVKRLEAAIERETILANRIDSRIAKLKSQQVITTDAEAKISIARTKIANAKSAVALATSKIQEAVSAANTASSTTTRGDAGKYVREEMNKAKQSLIEAHKALVDALNALKANKKATTTPESASSSAAQ